MENTSDLAALLGSRLDAYPVALPVISPGADTDSAAAIRELCDGTRTLADILASGDDVVALAEVLDSMVWLDEPVRRVAAAATKCLILSPGPELALTSMGGYVLKRQGVIEATHVVCFAPADGEPTEELEGTELPLARTDEASVCGAIAGVQTLHVDFPPHAVRTAAAGGDALQTETACRNALRVLLHHLIHARRPSDVFAPAAVGGDPDTKMLFDICLQIFEDGDFPDTRFHLYEPLPVAATHIAVDAFLAWFENAYVCVRPWFDDISPVRARKQSLLEIMRTARPADAARVIRAVGERNAILGRAGAAAERFWTLDLTFPVR